MRSWQRTATFLAFALIAAVIAFADNHYGTPFAPGVDAQLAAVEK